MGNYNPRPPFIMGEEWVPIRDEPIKFPNLDANFEIGYTMQLYGSEFVNNARLYTPEPVPQPSQAPVFAGIYPQGQESGGAVQRLIVPVSSAGVTGGSGVWSPSTSAAIADALNPGTSGFINWTQGGSPSSNPRPRIELFFPFNSYPILNGKRIVALNLIFLGNCSNIAGAGSPITATTKTFVSIIRSLAPGLGNSYADLTAWGMINQGAIDASVIPLSKLPLGNYTGMWLVGSNEQSNPMPWNYSDLQRFEVTNADRLALEIQMGLQTIQNDNVVLYTAYLEVLYCNETRVAVGGSILSPTNVGANVIPLRDPQTRVVTPLLPAGQYTVTVVNGDVGAHQTGAALTKHSPWNALRELYAIPSHFGLQMNLTQTVGEQFTIAQTHVLPQISVHTTGGVLQEPHVYGDAIPVPVFSGVSPSQVLSDGQVALGPSSNPAPFPWVRWYARRWGNTAGPLVLSCTNPPITASVVSITPDQLDALPEIIDGWREVTLRFPTVPSLGNISPDPVFQWSSSDSYQNRWEILGVDAPAVSGVASNLLNQAAQQLDGATYAPQPLVGTGSPAASSLSLTWQSPPASAVAQDSSADAVLMLAQDPQQVTNFAVSTQSQALTGFVDCGAGPCCIPTSLTYNRVTWTPTGYGDTFTRTVAPGGWGNLETSQPWTVTGDAGFSANDFFVQNGAGVMSHSQVNVQRLAYAGSTRDGEATYEFVVPAYALGGLYEVDIIARVQDKNNFYQFVARFQPNGTIDALIGKDVAGAFTTLVAKSNASAYAPGSRIKMRAQFYWTGANQCVLQMRVWDTSGSENLAWDVQTFGDASFGFGAVGLKTQLSAGNTNTLPFQLAIDKFTFTPRPGLSSEIQRLDPVDNVWKTVARPDPWIATFNDYEARVGVTSSYQIRSVDVLNFVSPWSVTGTATPAEPGVTMPSCGTNKRGILLFTTNEVQDGSSNLAYAMTFDADNVENFSFPESGNVQFTQMLDRDYAIMFHGTERGGEQFTRKLLIANAAVALPRLANVRSIRDLAWKDLSYVCVRDDIGDRWLAGVIVTDDEVRRNRRLYNANITVVETTATPTQVVVT